MILAGPILEYLRDSIFPIFMSQGHAVEHAATNRPFWNNAIHQFYETSVVRRFQQVRQFVDDDVFQAFARLLGQLHVEPDLKPLRWLQLPYFVFIRCTNSRFTFIPIVRSQLAINGRADVLS